MDYYDFNNWSQSSTSDGFAYTPDSGQTVIMVGGNDGSGVPGTTTFLIDAPSAGTVLFNYLYNSLDVPGFDGAGYVLNGVYSQFADTDGESGPVSFSVNSGDSFGFEVWTADNTGEPGFLTVSDFSGPDAAVPEPRTLPMVLLAAIAAAAYRRTRRRNVRSEEQA